ncbi:MAG TPA: sulfatase [Verrucomicrobiae bacterium]|nr:sulfatase [Verrucomicrobiae bacterium]
MLKPNPATLACAFLACAISFPAAAAPARRPNVLYVIADMERAFSMGCYGDKNAKTPTFDKFASEGLRLDACISTTPVCCPYRASLMSGQLAHHNGMVSNGCRFEPTTKCLGQTFKEAGYEMGYVGKWHLGRAERESDPTWGFPPPNSEYGVYHFGRSPTPTTDIALRFIKEKSNGSAPWMLFVSWIWPHAPYNPPEDLLKDFENVKLAIPPNVPNGAPREFAEKALPGYYGMIEGVDREFARLLKALDEAGVADNTIVVFTSDHGDMIGGHGYKAKRWPYEESARVPFLMRYPNGIRAGSTLADPFGATDIYPTLAGLAGVKAPGDLDGMDFSALFTGKTQTPPRDYVYMEMPYTYVTWPGWRAFRTKENMYARLVDRPWLLYNVAQDPWETNNLVTSHPDEVKKDDARLAEMMKKYGDSWSVKATSGDVRAWRPGGPKQRSQSLGVPYPGQVKEDSAPNAGGGKGKRAKRKRAAARQDSNQ